MRQLKLFTKESEKVQTPTMQIILHGSTELLHQDTRNDLFKLNHLKYYL